MAQTKITDHDGIASIAQANAPFSEACAYSLYGEIADGRVVGLVVDVQELSHFIGCDIFHQQGVRTCCLDADEIHGSGYVNTAPNMSVLTRRVPLSRFHQRLQIGRGSRRERVVTYG